MGPSNFTGEYVLKKIVEWLTKPQITDIEYYIASKDPKTSADVEQLIKEFNQKRKLQCF
jgi:hypothetical protein